MIHWHVICGVLFGVICSSIPSIWYLRRSRQILFRKLYEINLLQQLGPVKYLHTLGISVDMNPSYQLTTRERIHIECVGIYNWFFGYISYNAIINASRWVPVWYYYYMRRTSPNIGDQTCPICNQQPLGIKVLNRSAPSSQAWLYICQSCGGLIDQQFKALSVDEQAAIAAQTRVGFYHRRESWV